MPKPRYSQVSLASTPYYHCVSRCVRRAFLCGTDTLTGQSFEHRRQWIEDKILVLARIFALDVCAYAVMSNHYHVVLHVNQQAACSWSMDEIIQQWHQLFSGHALSQRYARGEQMTSAELATLQQITSTWRERLMDISWFMRVLNESIARQANAEDDCTGRFWEGRFKSQALLDEVALLACMTYVDLNPIRAGIAHTPEASDHTSIQRRIHVTNPSVTGLFPVVGHLRQDMPPGLPLHQYEYL
ncbi:MAG: transposase, partial [Gammaproteobacteria bacterium]|nr:transposase [Gammaproteobacteria bacterium]